MITLPPLWLDCIRAALPGEADMASPFRLTAVAIYPTSELMGFLSNGS